MRHLPHAFLLTIAAYGLLFASTPARAVEVDLLTVLLNQDGAPFQACVKLANRAGEPAVCEKTVDMTIGRLIANLVNAPEANLPFDEIKRRGELVERVSNSVRIDLDSRDVEIVKKLLEKSGLPNIEVYRAVQILDGRGGADLLKNMPIPK